MTTGQRVVDFTDCRTREAALAKFLGWYDDQCAEQLRSFGARLVDANDDVKEIASELSQLRAYLAVSRDDARARFAEVLDEAGRQGSA